MQTTEDHLPKYRVRPRFEISVPHDVDLLSEQLKLSLLKAESPCIGEIKNGYATIFMPVSEQHYWSPQLTLIFEAKEDGGTSLRGLYGPRPDVWTMFVFFYSLIAFAIVVIAVIGFSNVSLGVYTGILYVIPFLVVIFLSLYFVSWSGQKIGLDQMVVLHEFLEESLGIEIDASEE